MKARIIPPPERADDRTEEEKKAAVERLFGHIEITNKLRLMTMAAGYDYCTPFPALLVGKPYNPSHHMTPMEVEECSN